MHRRTKSKLAIAADVAKLANVSPSTVSRVFDPKWEGKVRESTRNRILDVAKSLGYTPNAIARSLNANRTNIVAVVTGELVGYFYAEVFFKLVKQIQSSGKQVLVFSVNPELGINHIVSQVHQYRVDAIIILANATSTYIENYFSENGTPVILFNRSSKDSKVNSIRSDIPSAIESVVNFLVKNDHRRLVYISGDANTSNELERTACFIENATAMGAQIVKKFEGDYSYGCGYRYAQEIAQSNSAIDAIFCCADTMALGAIDGLRALGKRVPEDISVMGFDSDSVGQMESFSLTTSRHAQDRLIDSCVSILPDIIANPLKIFETIIPMELVIRGSVKLQ